ncbi:ImmA/IrrE family metallo-endopeptidase [Streptomyces sp. NPDC006458]|uniref:ImmA/IrrE family metallo-endopeptidase n=1 Tax=Streptomyces sp. NPDC006458 TaxID=3154302 RepID=UPI0033B7976A
MAPDLGIHALTSHVSPEPGDRITENQANRFAAEFLMPADEMRDLLPPKADWRTLGALKADWNVSPQALLYRSRQLGVMSDVTYRNAVLYLSSKGWRRREPGVMPVTEQPSLFPKAVEVLGQVGIGEEVLAGESRVPLDLFRVVTSRFPIWESPQSTEPSPEGHLPSGVISLFRSARK